MKVELQHIHKKYGAYSALTDISFEVPEGTLLSLLGPSGCGKTTLLRIISGLETPDAGNVFLDGKDITNIGDRSKVGFVFQHYALFQHMRIFDNVAFGLQVKPAHIRPSKKEIEERVHEVLALVQLDNQSKKYPSQLSGGQQQRVALARVLAIQPRVLLLDEPFGALDANVRRSLRRWLRDLHERIQITTILVTHDQEEALEISDNVVLLNQGVLEQIGSPQQVYEQPSNHFVYEFLGQVNIFNPRFHNDHLVHYTPDGKESPIAHKGHFYVRPHDIEIVLLDSKKKKAQGVIIRTSFVAEKVLLQIRLDESSPFVARSSDKKSSKPDGQENLVEASIGLRQWRTYNYAVGDKVGLSFS